MKLILSTSNILGVSSAIRRSAANVKSNVELVSSLRANFDLHAEHVQTIAGNAPNNGTNRHGHATTNAAKSRSWTRYTEAEDRLEIPVLDFANATLEEEREQYDITMKLFFLPGAKIDKRESQIKEAIDLVLRELQMPSIDLLIVSFPGIYFDEEEECPDKLSTRGPVEAEPEPLEDQLTTWKVLEGVHDAGTVTRLGVAEFGRERLNHFIAAVDVKPNVDQINLRDCCSVPQDLMRLAKTHQIDLLVHNDCSNILPRGTLRELLGPGPNGADVLASGLKSDDKRKSHQDLKRPHFDDAGRIQGEVHPQWVARYTAVVKNRGVLENKGYFAVAEVD